jgi:plastocyanin
MKRFLTSIGLVVLLAALVLPIPATRAEAASPQTYTVLVGMENKYQGVVINAFFPGTVTIHAGDTVHWQLNSSEIHTVTFGFAKDAALPPLDVPTVPPPSFVMVNPAVSNQAPLGGGQYTGGMANSGIMGLDDGEIQAFDLTFPNEGSYLYVCLVHGWMMWGMVEVVGPDVAIRSPNQSLAMARQEMAAFLAQVPAVLRNAQAQIVPPTMNPDGSMTHTVLLGYMEGQIMLARFFPDTFVVSPGDTVEWKMPEVVNAPHTVTFLNGTPAPPLFIPVQQPNQLPLLYVNLDALLPAKLGEPLTRDGYYNSGVMPIFGLTYSLTIDASMTPGPEPFLCQLHDGSGMVGTLLVRAK